MDAGHGAMGHCEQSRGRKAGDEGVASWGAALGRLETCRRAHVVVTGI